MSIPSQWDSLPDWMRMVARDLNPVVEGYPYMQLASEPASPTEGFTFYDTTDHVVKTYDGTNWQAHW